MAHPPLQKVQPQMDQAPSKIPEPGILTSQANRPKVAERIDSVAWAQVYTCWLDQNLHEHGHTTNKHEANRLCLLIPQVHKLYSYRETLLPQDQRLYQIPLSKRLTQNSQTLEQSWLQLFKQAILQVKADAKAGPPPSTDQPTRLN